MNPVGLALTSAALEFIRLAFGQTSLVVKWSAEPADGVGR
jgi:hypothetical protein